MFAQIPEGFGCLIFNLRRFLLPGSGAFFLVARQFLISFEALAFFGFELISQSRELVFEIGFERGESAFDFFAQLRRLPGQTLLESTKFFLVVPHLRSEKDVSDLIHVAWGLWVSVRLVDFRS